MKLTTKERDLLISAIQTARAHCVMAIICLPDDNDRIVADTHMKAYESVLSKILAHKGVALK